MIEHRLSCIIRPDASGNWFIQDDVDHHAQGFYSLTQTSTHLELTFLSTYDKAGTIQISADDDFAGSLVLGGNLGLSSSLVKLRIPGSTTVINPSQVWSALPNLTPGSGNFWVNVTMWRNP